MKKAELIKFRRKLVKAKRNCLEYRDRFCTLLGIAGFSDREKMQIINKKFGKKDIWNWNYGASQKQRIAMWDNSIAHVDKLIAEAK